MTSADFPQYRCRYCGISPGKSIFLPPIPAASTYLPFFVIFGHCKDVVAYPGNYASYAVPVRQYRILQSGFLHCCRYRQPACHLLTIRELNPPVRDFHPLENCTLIVCQSKFICNFKLFLKLTTSVRLHDAHAGRTQTL